MSLRSLLLVGSLVVASSSYGIPLTWHFSGTTDPGSTYNGMSIEGRAFELRIFLDTDLVGMKPDPTLADVFFFGPHQGEVEIDMLGVLPVFEFADVQYFAPGGLVTAVQFEAPFSDIAFPSSISSDSLHLTPIPPTAPSFNDDIEWGGPNDLDLFSTVTTFSAATNPTTVPDGASTALLLTSSVAALGFLRARWNNRRQLIA